MPSPAAALLVGAIARYRRWVSPLIGRRCRFHPTCSVYASEAIAAHGAFAGTMLALRRLARCHPWSAGGNDPIPPRRSEVA